MRKPPTQNFGPIRPPVGVIEDPGFITKQFLWPPSTSGAIILFHQPHDFFGHSGLLRVEEEEEYQLFKNVGAFLSR